MYQKVDFPKQNKENICYPIDIWEPSEMEYLFKN